MKNLQLILADIAHLTGLAITKQGAIEKGFDYYLELEYASHYGGYRLINVNITNGGHRGAFGESASCSRRSLKVMTAYLDGIYNGIKTIKTDNYENK